MIKVMKNIFKLLAFLPLFTSCADLFDPALENNREIDAMYDEPSFAQGILANAYILLPYTSPYNSPVTNEVATDNAVLNDVSNNWVKLATGMMLYGQLMRMSADCLMTDSKVRLMA